MTNANRNDTATAGGARRARLTALRPKHPVATAFVVVIAALVIAPLASLAHIAFGADDDIWRHIVAYVLPRAMIDTLGLLAGVAAITAIVGVGTAWIVTAFEFPGRNAFAWLLPLPLAFPTYIVAYVYVDICDGLGPVQTALHFVFGGARADYLLPSIRSLGGAIFVMGFVLYPYVYLAARAMFQTQSAPLIEMARMLGASRWNLTRHITLPLARPAIAVGLSLALARSPERHRRQRISRRAHADAVDLHHLAQPRQPAGRGADRRHHADRDRGADRA